MVSILSSTKQTVCNICTLNLRQISAIMCSLALISLISRLNGNLQPLPKMIGSLFLTSMQKMNRDVNPKNLQCISSSIIVVSVQKLLNYTNQRHLHSLILIVFQHTCTPLLLAPSTMLNHLLKKEKSFHQCESTAVHRSLAKRTLMRCF